MGRCSVLGCPKKYINKKHQKITLHRLPTCKERKKQWLDILGVENLNTTNKQILICSLHFEDKCFNRTLDVTRLRDDALPSRELLLLSAQFHDSEKQQPVPHKVSEEKPICSTFNYAELPNQFEDSDKPQSVPYKVFEEKSVCSTPDVKDVITFENAIIQKLKSKCENQKKKIKRLNETIRRQSKEIADFKTLIIDLKDRNLVNDSYATVLEQCAGPKDFLKRQIVKSIRLPVERQYSEEIRKFASKLHFLSPKAYSFVRRTYSTCLPHPRTLNGWTVNAEPGNSETQSSNK